MNKEQTTNQKIEEIKKAMVTYENFPKPGLNFIDVFSITSKPHLFTYVTDIFAEHLQKVQYDKIFMLESRGFFFGVPLSLKLNKPCYPIRKKGKLPG